MSPCKDDVNPYKDKNGEPIFKESFCAYLDCLGFSQMIERKDWKEVFYEFRNALNEGKEKYLNITAVEPHGVVPTPVKLFTDNIVFGVLVNDEECLELVRIIGFAGSFQLSMALKGYFYRGGISKAEFYVDNDMVFGPALLKSIDIEEKTSVYPRIVIDNIIMEDTKKVLNPSQVDIQKMIRKSVLKFQDNRYFVNYLYFAKSLGIKNFDLEKINKHAQLIEDRLQEFSDNERVREKYIWLAKYHNYFCDIFLSDGNGDRISLPREFEMFSIY